MTSPRLTKLLAIAAITFTAASHNASATLIAQYTFDGPSPLADSSGSGTVHDLTATGGAPTFTGGIGTNGSKAYASDGIALNYLNDTGPGGSGQWTVSLWAYTENLTQANGGVFGNNLTVTGSRFDITLDSGNYHLNYGGGTASRSFGPAVSGTWQNLVVSKIPANTQSIFLNGVEVGTNLASNPGGLQNFIVGLNRSGGSFDGYIDSIQVWNGENVSASAIYANGPSLGIPESGSTLAMLGLVAAGLMGVRRRK